jgi:hypothetical protein
MHDRLAGLASGPRTRKSLAADKMSNMPRARPSNAVSPARQPGPTSMTLLQAAPSVPRERAERPTGDHLGRETLRQRCPVESV